MAASTLWRDSIIVFFMVVISGYVAALFLNLIFNPADRTDKTAILAGGLLLVVIALGFFLWRSTENESAA